MDMDNRFKYDEDRMPELGLDAWIRRMAGDGQDVRIHDSAQAGELVRRLGARAFTAGKDVYIRPELVRPMSREGASVLAHELFHVAEQTGRPAPAMPLASGAGRAQGTLHTNSPASTPQPVQRQVALSVQRTEGATSASEAGAERHEDATRGEGRRRRQSPPDPEVVAERVYDLMSRELRLDNERTTFGW